MSHPPLSSPTEDHIDVRRILTYDERETLVKKKGFNQEREFQETARYPAFYSLLKKNGLLPLAKKRTQANLEFVYRYYACKLNIHCDDNFEMRGKYFNIDPPMIRRVYKMPQVQNCKFDDIIDGEGEYPYEAIPKALCRSDRAQWHQPRDQTEYLHKQDLTDAAKVWLHFICTNIMPSKHVTEVTPHLALLIYLLSKGEKVDVATLIYQSLLKSGARKSKTLLFPHLLSDCFRKAGVPELEADPKLKPVGPFDYSRMTTHDGASSSRNRRPSTIHDRLDALQEAVDRISLERETDRAILLHIARSMGHPFEMPEQEGSGSETEAEDDGSEEGAGDEAAAETDDVGDGDDADAEEGGDQDADD